VSQGKTTIPGVNDGEEMELTDVRKKYWLNVHFVKMTQSTGHE
jgi:hypothetical protein